MKRQTNQTKTPKPHQNQQTKHQNNTQNQPNRKAPPNSPLQNLQLQEIIRGKLFFSSSYLKSILSGLQ